jgi:alpha/beta superfamily hydrolase
VVDPLAPIKSVTVLPAIREDVTFTTEDGLTLVGELALPTVSPAATLITLHPLPLGGGFMDSHLFRKAAWILPYLADLAVLRFNTRGTRSPRGVSEGSFDGGVGEGADVRAAVEFAASRGLKNLWLVGWSFGSDLALIHGHALEVEGAFLISPTLSRARIGDLEAWADTGRPVTVLVPEHDEFLPPVEAQAGFAPLRGAEVLVGEGASHLWVGERHVRWVLDRIVERVAPTRSPVPTEVPQGVIQGR